MPLSKDNVHHLTTFAALEAQGLEPKDYLTVFKAILRLATECEWDLTRFTLTKKEESELVILCSIKDPTSITVLGLTTTEDKDEASYILCVCLFKEMLASANKTIEEAIKLAATAKDETAAKAAAAIATTEDVESIGATLETAKAAKNAAQAAQVVLLLKSALKDTLPTSFANQVLKALKKRFDSLPKTIITPVYTTLALHINNAALVANQRILLFTTLFLIFNKMMLAGLRTIIPTTPDWSSTLFDPIQSRVFQTFFLETDNFVNNISLDFILNAAVISLATLAPVNALAAIADCLYPNTGRLRIAEPPPESISAARSGGSTEDSTTESSDNTAPAASSSSEAKPIHPSAAASSAAASSSPETEPTPPSTAASSAAALINTRGTLLDYTTDSDETSATDADDTEEDVTGHACCTRFWC